MLKNVLAGLLVASCAVVAIEAQQGGGRGGARGGGGGAAAENFPTAAEFAASKDAQAHVAAAMKIGGADMADTAKWFCTATGPQRLALARQAQGLPAIPDRPVGPIKMFDNLYYVGFNDVGAWVIPTSAGIIMFDALNSTEDMTTVVEPGLRKIGLDPAQIKIALLGHGHNDHTGGASYLQTKYGVKMYMAAPDWEMVARAARPDRPQPKRDADVTDGQKLTLGDTTVTVVQLPGHTPGTIGMIVPAKYQGRTHNVMIMSGTQMPTQDSLNAFVHVFNDLAKPNHVEAAYGSHPDILLNSLSAMEAIGAKYPTGAHPLLLSEEKFNRYGAIMLECARARLAAQGKLGTN